MPARRSDWAPSEPTEEERAVFRRYMDADERRDFVAMAELLREDARLTMPPTASWFEGREAITALFASWLDPGSTVYVAEVRRIEDGKLAESTMFVSPELFSAFGLAPTI